MLDAECRRLRQSNDRIGPLANKVWDYCEAKGFRGKTVTVKIRYSDFKQTTRGRAGTLAFSTGKDVYDAVSELLNDLFVQAIGATALRDGES
jgi:DNA polymerase IV